MYCSPPIAYRYPEPESRFGSLDEEDADAEDFDGEKTLEDRDDKEDKEVRDPYTEDEQENERSEAIGRVHIDALLSHFSPTSRARSPDMLSSTASSRVARSAHIRSTFSSSADHSRTRENDRPPTCHRKRARHLHPPCAPWLCPSSVAVCPTSGDCLQSILPPVCAPVST
jgi:hypothetical protein